MTLAGSDTVSEAFGLHRSCKETAKDYEDKEHTPIVHVGDDSLSGRLQEGSS